MKKPIKHSNKSIDRMCLKFIAKEAGLKLKNLQAFHRGDIYALTGDELKRLQEFMSKFQ